LLDVALDEYRSWMRKCIDDDDSGMAVKILFRLRIGTAILDFSSSFSRLSTLLTALSASAIHE
jgi:hypothetical protein